MRTRETTRLLRALAKCEAALLPHELVHAHLEDVELTFDEFDRCSAEIGDVSVVSLVVQVGGSPQRFQLEKRERLARNRQFSAEGLHAASFVGVPTIELSVNLDADIEQFADAVKAADDPAAFML